jgi:hypothetical protein
MVHEQAAAFALDALDRREAAEFELHLATCPGCEDELKALRLAATALAFAGELPPPPPELRRRVLDVKGVAVPFRRRALPLLSIAAAGAACAALGFGLHAAIDRSQPARGAARAYPLHGGRGALLVGADGEAILVVRRLPPAPPGKAYEVWVVRRGRPAGAGFLRGSMVELTKPVPPGTGVAVTLEPETGSRRPTGPFLLKAETA